MPGTVVGGVGARILPDVSLKPLYHFSTSPVMLGVAITCTAGQYWQYHCGVTFGGAGFGCTVITTGNLGPSQPESNWLIQKL